MVHTRFVVVSLNEDKQPVSSVLEWAPTVWTDSMVSVTAVRALTAAKADRTATDLAEAQTRMAKAMQQHAIVSIVVAMGEELS